MSWNPHPHLHPLTPYLDEHEGREGVGFVDATEQLRLQDVQRSARFFDASVVHQQVKTGVPNKLLHFAYQARQRLVVQHICQQLLLKGGVIQDKTD